ncbi:MAG: T9SS type B sorting domain-containing protein [Saprospiraceae bacterium]|nr:T9SS type B sorting domain-containing protein [Saprospiraceae bacterium]
MRTTSTIKLIIIRLCIIIVLSSSYTYLLADPITITGIDQTQETCNLSNGTLLITATGGAGQLFYSIDGGTVFQDSNFFEGLQSGDYLIVVTDGIACTEISTAQIADAPEPLLNISYQCIDTLNAATINLEPFDGISPYTFSWLGPNGTTYTSEDLDNVEPGMYFITVTDALGCQIDSSILVPTCCVLDIECAIQNSTTLQCINELDEIDLSFQDQVSVANEDQILISTRGITINSACHTIIVQAFDSQNSPQSCNNDPLIVTREYQISDGAYTVSCFEDYIIEDHAPILITQEAQNISHACNQDINARLQEWIDNIASTQFDICSDPLTVTIDPPNPQVNYSCQGSGSVNVTFYLEDACGNRDTTTARFSVFDNIGPSIGCPADLDVIIQQNSDLDQIDTWLDSTSPFDACGPVTVTNDYSEIMLSDDCEASTSVTFTATDDCGNSNTCRANITIQNNINPLINCPTSLTIECGQSGDAAVSDWLNSALGESSTGTMLSVNSDYNPAALDQLICGESLDVIFSVSDNCQRSNFCTSTIMLVDNNAPDIICPSTIEIEALGQNQINEIENWLLQVVASDQCTQVDLSNSFDPSILNDLCSAEEFMIQFVAEDQCGNSNDCLGTITVTKAPPSISCPLAIELDCEDPDLDQKISDWLNLAEANNDQSNLLVVDHDYLSSNLLFGCNEVNIVNFITEDACNQIAECVSQIRITDSSPPTINCPDDMTIDLVELDYQATFDTWQNTIAGSDGCGNFDIVYNDQINITFEACEITEPYEYTIIDGCNNTSSCISNLTVINEFNISITCPEDITVGCSHPQTSAAVDGFLNQTIVESELSYMVFNDYTFNILNSDCQESYDIDVIFTAEDECGTLADCEASIHLLPDMKIYIPNIFSPNSDDLNDAFTVYGNSSLARVITLTIYDRWGSKIHEASDFPPNDSSYGWEGNFNESEVSGEVFTYLVQVLDIFNQEHTFTGSIQAIK